VNVDTGAFRALTGQVAALEAEVAGLRCAVTGEAAEGAALRNVLIDLGRALERHEQAQDAARRRARRSRPGYLQVLGGGGAS
jgi:hypothetical protein